MDREETLAAFIELERHTFAFENTDADPDTWADENTPPVEQLPVFDVRLDAGIDSVEDREYRLFVRVGRGTAPEDHVGTIVDVAKEAGASIRFENNGIEIS